MRWTVTLSPDVCQALQDVRRTDPILYQETLRTLDGMHPTDGAPVDEWGDLRRVTRPYFMLEFFIMPLRPELHVIRMVCLEGIPDTCHPNRA